MSNSKTTAPVPMVPLTPRSRTPPSYLSFSARNVVPPSFNTWKVENVKGVPVPGDAQVTQCAWNVDGQRLATCGNEPGIRLWAPEKSTSAKNAVKITHSAPEGTIPNATALVWNTQHPELLCSASWEDKLLTFWDARKTGPTHRLNCPKRVTQLKYTPNGEGIIMLDIDKRDSVISWLESRKLPGKEQVWEPVLPQLTNAGDIRQFAVGHTGELLFACTSAGQIKCAEFPSMEIIETMDSHIGTCYTIDLDPRGGYLATGGTDGMINIFNNVDMISHSSICLLNTPVRHLSYSFDGEYIAASSDDKELIIVSSVNGQVLRRGIEQLGSPACIEWHPSRHILASCGDRERNTSPGWVSFIGLSTA